jgi:hypothetical protein
VPALGDNTPPKGKKLISMGRGYFGGVETVMKMLKKGLREGSRDGFGKVGS